MDEFEGLDEAKQDRIRERMEHFEHCADHMFIDSNTIDRAIFMIDEIKSLETGLDKITRKSEFYAKYKAAKQKIDSLLEAGENATSKLRQKIYGFLMQGGESDHAKLRKGDYEVEVSDITKVPVSYLVVNEKLVKEHAKEMDGNLAIPGLLIKPTRQLVIKIKDKK